MMENNLRDIKDIRQSEIDAKIKARDVHWAEVMDLAKQYGFICQAYGGTAILATNQNQLEQLGGNIYLRRQIALFGDF